MEPKSEKADNPKYMMKFHRFFFQMSTVQITLISKSISSSNLGFSGSVVHQSPS